MIYFQKPRVRENNDANTNQFEGGRKKVSLSVKMFVNSIRKLILVEQSYLCWADPSVHGGPWNLWNSHTALINMANILWKQFLETNKRNWERVSSVYERKIAFSTFRNKRKRGQHIILDGVGPVDNRPPPISFTTLSKKERKRKRDTLHVTHDTWHNTRDTWHIWGGEHSLKISAP